MKDDFAERELTIKRDLKDISYPQIRRFLNYLTDVGIFITVILLFTSGLIKFLNIWADLESLSFTAAFLTDMHDWSGIVLGFLVFLHLIFHWKWIVAMTKKIFKSSKSRMKKINYFIDIGMLISLLFVFITGILKFPSLRLINQYFSNISIQIFILHDWTGIILTILALSHVVLHWKWIARMTKKIFRKNRVKSLLKIIGIIGFIFLIITPFQFLSTSPSFTEDTIVIQGIGNFQYKPEEINTVRTDIFRTGHFSIFDILVDLDNRGEIKMEYHHDIEMDTFIIDSINGTVNWWYTAYYHGGWEETNVFRIDHYPYKPKMYIRLFTVSTTRLGNIYNTFREEVLRLNVNNGTIIIPSIQINSQTNNLDFLDVEVSSHNIRNDMFQDGVITAIDVIMSLGDQGLLTYILNWYTVIGTAEVKNYYVDRINQDEARGTCGFVYEAGDLDYYGFSGNHIHIPADIRVITSPEYEKWFYICL